MISKGWPSKVILILSMSKTAKYFIYRFPAMRLYYANNTFKQMLETENLLPVLYMLPTQRLNASYTHTKKRFYHNYV